MKFTRIVISVLAIVSSLPASAAPSKVPWQFITRLYTEALGRAPDQNGYQSKVNYFSSAGCNTASITSVVSSVYNSTEYSGLGYDNASRLLTLYRGLLRREPDTGGFNYLYGVLQNNTISWAQLVNQFVSGPEFQNLIPTICTDEAYGWLSNGRPIPLPVSAGSTFSGGTGDQLQQVLNNTAPGGTVTLAKKSVTYADKSIVVPAGVTLRTLGIGYRTQYAAMGRIVRDGPENSIYPLLVLSSGSKLINVWTDGRAGAPTSLPRADNGNIAIAGGNVDVVDNRSSDNAGHYDIGFLPISGNSCTNVVIRNNLNTAYANNRTVMSTDGIQVACIGVEVRRNEIVDIPDIGIVLFAVNGTRSDAVILENIVFNSAMPSNGAIGLEPLQYPTLMPNFDFSNVSVSRNIIWTSPSPNAYLDIVFSLGTRAFWGIPGFPNSSVGYSRTGSGGTFTYNTSDDGTGSPQKINASSGFLVSGEVGVTVLNNTLSLNLRKWNFNCPVGALVLSRTSAYASGSFDQPITYATDRQDPLNPTAPYIDGCVFRG